MLNPAGSRTGPSWLTTRRTICNAPGTHLPIASLVITYDVCVFSPRSGKSVGRSAGLGRAEALSRDGAALSHRLLGERYDRELLSACKALAIGLFIAVLFKLQDKISVGRNPMGAVTYTAREQMNVGRRCWREGSPKLRHPTMRLLSPKAE